MANDQPAELSPYLRTQLIYITLSPALHDLFVLAYDHEPEEGELVHFFVNHNKAARFREVFHQMMSNDNAWFAGEKICEKLGEDVIFEEKVLHFLIVKNLIDMKMEDLILYHKLRLGQF